jgi:hypothetical protein
MISRQIDAPIDSAMVYHDGIYEVQIKDNAMLDFWQNPKKKTAYRRRRELVWFAIYLLSILHRAFPARFYM